MSGELRARLVRFAFVLGLIATVGTVGFMLIERWSFVDALYMSIITLSTVGFGEVGPLTTEGKLFTIGLIVSGVGAVTYAIGAISQSLASEFRGDLRVRRLWRRIEMLQDHFIVCGYGRVGRQVVRDLSDRGASVVIIEVDAERIDSLSDEWPVVRGDGADDEVLKSAGIERARGLVAVTGDDATNVFVTLSARSLREDMTIVARANEPATNPKLLRAGASQVISPYTISGHRIATQLLHPSVTDFLDVVMHTRDLGLWIEEITVRANSSLAGKTFDESEIRSGTGVNVLAVKRPGTDQLITTPSADLTFEAGDMLIGLATNDQLEKLIGLAGDVTHRLSRSESYSDLDLS